MRRSTCRVAAWCICLVSPFALSGMSGCTMDLEAVLATVEEDGGPSADTVRVRFQNFASGASVDVEFFASNEPISNPEDELFQTENRRASGIGIAGTGILQPLTQDSIDLLCTPDLVLGTSGGTFLNSDTGEVLGTGQVRWIRESQLGLCGTVVTLVYSGADGEFLARLRTGG